MVVKGLYNPKMKLPRIPCSDAAGEVVAVGAGVTAWKPGDRVAGIFMQNWLDGPLTRSKARGALGGDIDGVLADYVVLKEQGLVAIPEPPELSGSRNPALRRGDGLERPHHRRNQAGIDGADSGNGRRAIFALQFARLKGRAGAGHQLERREAGAGRRAWASTRD